jgi:hypothetical protein
MVLVAQVFNLCMRRLKPTATFGKKLNSHYRAPIHGGRRPPYILHFVRGCFGNDYK